MSPILNKLNGILIIIHFERHYFLIFDARDGLVGRGRGWSFFITVTVHSIEVILE